MASTVYIDRFDSAGDLRGKARTYEAVKAAVLEAGRYSVFEATETQASARLFTRLDRDPEVERFEMGHPWIGIRRRVEGAPLPPPPPTPGRVIYLDDADPYHDLKVYHYAKHMHSETGAVSPLCAKRPRALDLSRETWTLRKAAVTCAQCLTLLFGAPVQAGTEG